MTGTLYGSGVALPSRMRQQDLYDEFFAAHYGDSRLARRAWLASGVTTRHGVVDPRVEDVSSWTTGARMRRFLPEAMGLGKSAVSAALATGGLAPEEVDAFTVVTCTGYHTPGLDILLARDLGFRDDVQRLQVGHMGCYAALPALAAASDAATARGQRVALLTVELPSLHVQPPSDDLEQIVAHALFADAAAAVTVQPGDAPGGLSVVEIRARTDVANADLMSWDITDHGFRMRLSPKVPRILREHVAATVDDLLGDHGLLRADVTAWAVHPGGPRIIDVVADRLGLDEDAVADSRAVLASNGNCSSATILMILERLRARNLAAGDLVVALAFGPGLTLYTALLRAT